MDLPQTQQQNLDKYRGLSAEEARRQMEEDKRRAIYEDPRTVAAVRAAEKHKRQQEAEAEQRRRQLEEDRRAGARAELEAEKESKRSQWLDAGGDAESFERAWPEIRQQILMGKMLTDEERERRSESVF